VEDLADRIIPHYERHAHAWDADRRRSRWKPIEKLTINYGVRFELYDGLTRADQASPRIGATYSLFRNMTFHESGQFNFAPDELAYIANHYTFLDHDQTFSASAGAVYTRFATALGSAFSPRNTDRAARSTAE